MALADRLREMKPPEADAHLAGLWRQFSQTEYFEALDLILAELDNDIRPALLNPSSSNELRAHAAGGASAIFRIRSTIRAALTFNPAAAEYGPESAVDPNSIVAPPDPFTVI